MEKLKVGIVGCGKIFPVHAYSVKALPDASLIAVCDTNKEKALEKANDFNCKAYFDYQDMLADTEIDVIHICTPHYLHPQMTIDALNAKKHVLTEKPMSVNLADTHQMLEVAKKNEMTLGVIFQGRYNSNAQLIKKTIESGELGKVHACKMHLTWNRSDEYYTKSGWKGTWEKEGGGVIIDQAIHMLDLMRWFVNDDIDYIEASIATHAHDTIEVEDAAYGLIKFKQGVLGMFYAVNYYSYDAPVEMEIHCENGLINMKGELATINFADGKTISTDRNPNEFFDYGTEAKSYWGVSHIKQIGNYYRSILSEEPLYIPPEEAIKTQAMVNTIYASAKQNKRIYL